MAIPSEKELLKCACHFGHRKEKWNPRMAPYIYGTRKGIHIVDLEKTKKGLENVCSALKKLQTEGKTILFVSTKQQSIGFIEQLGKSLKQPVVTKKWMPGLITNWNTVRERIKYYLDLKESFRSGEIEKYTKKEQVALRKAMNKLEIALGGVSKMSRTPDAIFVIDALIDNVAILEARKLRIPVYGICDTNADPDLFTAFVPANDDAVNSIHIITATIAEELGGSMSAEMQPTEDIDE
jgi:small subunit ribosomal protein S2